MDKNMEMDKFEARCMAADVGMAVEPGQERTVEMVTLEIRTLHKQAQQVVLGYAIEIGRRLVEVKSMLPHGAWGDYLKNEVNYSHSTANNFMRIFEEYGAAQQSLFGPEAKSQTLGNLPYTKALQLIAVPEDEREEFVREHDVENISSRELQRIIRERDQAVADAKAAEQARDKMQDDMRLANARLTSANAETLNIQHKLEFEKNRADGYQKMLQGQKEKAQAAQEQLDKLRRDLEEARNRPVEVAVQEPDPAVIEAAAEKAAKEAAAEAKRKTEERLKKQIQAAEQAKAEADAAVEAAREEQRAAQQRAEELEKQLVLARAAQNPAIVEFKVHFDAVQKEFSDLYNSLEQVSGEERQKLVAAFQALCKAMMERTAGKK